MEVGSAVKPVAVAVQITKVGKVKPNQTVVVFGCGPIGILCQAVSKAYAAQKVIGVDIRGSLVPTMYSCRRQSPRELKTPHGARTWRV